MSPFKIVKNNKFTIGIVKKPLIAYQIVYFFVYFVPISDAIEFSAVLFFILFSYAFDFTSHNSGYCSYLDTRKMILSRDQHFSSIWMLNLRKLIQQINKLQVLAEVQSLQKRNMLKIAEINLQRLFTSLAELAQVNYPKLYC